VTSQTKGSTGLADRYAAALFELAESDKALDRVADELQQLNAMISGSDDLGRLIRSPVIARAEQQQALDAILATGGFSPLVRRFVGLVTRNRRLFALPRMIQAFLDRIARSRGETSAEVVSASALSSAQLNALRAELKAAIGSDVAVASRVDPDLLGGLVVKIGSRMVDSSLKTKLQRLSLAIKGIG
jgi:F-type H+-transporting ATPase subunit delta